MRTLFNKEKCSCVYTRTSPQLPESSKLSGSFKLFQPFGTFSYQTDVSGGKKLPRLEVQSNQDPVSSFTYPFTNDNKWLHAIQRFCQDSKYFMIFYHRDYLSHKMQIYAIRIVAVKYTQCVY